jgi:hypothetical protein
MGGVDVNLMTQDEGGRVGDAHGTDDQRLAELE